MRAVLFDLDDTLYPEGDFVAGGFRAVAAHLAARHGFDENAVQERMLELVQKEGRGKVFDLLLKGLDIYTPERVRLLVYLYRSHEPVLRPFECAPGILRHLKQAGLLLGIITDGMGAVQRRKIAALGVADLVDVIVCTDELGQEHWKPSTVPFAVALERLNVPATECVYVGDDPSKDFLGANALGILTIHVRGSTRREPEYLEGDPRGATFTVDTLEEILPIIESHMTAGQVQ